MIIINNYNIQVLRRRYLYYSNYTDKCSMIILFFIENRHNNTNIQCHQQSSISSLLCRQDNVRYNAWNHQQFHREHYNTNLLQPCIRFYSSVYFVLRNEEITAIDVGSCEEFCCIM